ncbi:hypothetical protein AVEN_41140-1, partial [Araneus ventricosus]
MKITFILRAADKNGALRVSETSWRKALAQETKLAEVLEKDFLRVIWARWHLMEFNEAFAPLYPHLLSFPGTGLLCQIIRLAAP